MIQGRVGGRELRMGSFSQEWEKKSPVSYWLWSGQRSIQESHPQSWETTGLTLKHRDLRGGLVCWEQRRDSSRRTDGCWIANHGWSEAEVSFLLNVCPLQMHRHLPKALAPSPVSVLSCLPLLPADSVMELAQSEGNCFRGSGIGWVYRCKLSWTIRTAPVSWRIADITGFQLKQNLEDLAGVSDRTQQPNTL